MWAKLVALQLILAIILCRVSLNSVFEMKSTEHFLEDAVSIQTALIAKYFAFYVTVLMLEVASDEEQELDAYLLKEE